MADIELVVKIPKEIYNYVQHMGSIPIINIQQIANAIFDGTPLPEGHGRLGDLDELTQRITNYIKHNEHMMDELTLLQEKFILEGIKDTHTIIETDRESEDADSN